MKLSIATFIRRIVAVLSLGNLKEYLTKSQAVLPAGSSLKAIINREIIDNKNLSLESLNKTYKKLKEIIKGYETLVRPPFQKLILEPIQNVSDKTRFFDPTDFSATLEKQKKIMRMKEEELSKSRSTVRDVSTIPFPKVICED